MGLEIYNLSQKLDVIIINIASRGSGACGRSARRNAAVPHTNGSKNSIRL